MRPSPVLPFTLLLLFLSVVNAWSSTSFSTAHPTTRRRQQFHHILLASASVSSPTEANTKKSVLIIGNGGREFALAQALATAAPTSRIGQIFVAPGNAGTAASPTPTLSVAAAASPQQQMIDNLPDLKPSDHAGIATYAKEHAIDLVVVGPEDPLVKGLADYLREEGIPCFGPSAAAARIEGSKAWAKEFMSRHKIPTASYAIFSDLQAAKKHIQQQQQLPIVVKASGLAGGKGVTVAETREKALVALEAIMGPSKVFGEEAGAQVVIEECLVGEEISMMGLCDGLTVKALPCARDYKRLLDGDQGPNTGGMGSIAPVPGLRAETIEKMRAILQQVVTGMREEGHPYQGVLYGGFMVDATGEPKVLEFNCRFGDPETQSILPLLSDGDDEGQDLYALFTRSVQGTLADKAATPTHTHRQQQAAAATVIAASDGYPTSTNPVPQHIIHGLPIAARVPGVHSIVHAGTTKKVLNNGARVIATSGGRVLGVTGLAPTLRLALLHAYHGLSEVRFQGMQYRKDIGAKALRSASDTPVRVAILGSTRGTSVQPLLRGKKGEYEVVLVMSDQQDGGLLANAREAGVADCRFLGGGGGGSKEEIEDGIEKAMTETSAEVLLLNGYNRILSPRLVRVLRGRCLNVHPSLLPDFAGHFDLAVHQAVLDAGKTESGCTIHFVTDEVDQGPVLIQEKCVVEPGRDTAASLKGKVQALETLSWEAALRVYREDFPRIVDIMMKMR